ncbi:MAG: M56 family metallopeptidase, partial [Bacteroidota bacterium]
MEPFFIYLLKCGGIITVFFAIYFFLLRHETFFVHNRYFLLGGIVIALLLPLLIFTKTVYVDQPQLNIAQVATGTVNNAAPYYTMNGMFVFLCIYLTGVCFLLGRFVIQLLSLWRLIRNSTMVTDGNFKMVVTKEKITPFSFFNYIVYHPGTYKDDELHTIVEHEKTHASQWHSIDILLTHLFTIFLWINPLIWMYKSSIAQNLEYIADGKAARRTKCIKKYQYLLLNTSTGYTMALTNNFFNSLIKKRIIMLNKSKSKQKNMWKYGVIIPFLAAFLFTFNVKTVAQSKVIKIKGDHVEVAEMTHFSIDKNTTDEALIRLKAEIRGEDGAFTYKDLERNSRGEITSITIKFKDGEERFVTGNYSDDDGIQPIVFGHNEKGEVFITSGSHNSELHVKGKSAYTRSDDNVIVTGKGGAYKYKLKKAGDSDHIVHFDEDSDGSIIIIEKDGKGKNKKGKKYKKAYKVKKAVGSGYTVHVDEDDADDVIIIEKDAKGKEDKKHEAHKKVKIRTAKSSGTVTLSNNGKEPLIFIDGKQVSRKKMEKLDTDNIEKIEVLKGDSAIEKYGEDAEDGVILI